jgi:hypothetical protein
MFEFNPRSPYHRRMWHYESDRPLSVAQLVALGSLDARTAALLWVLIERHSSVIVSGPTDPTPGVGKTTTLNALLGFLPAGSTLVYTMGMYEDFEFQAEVNPATTCVLANEVSDHLRIYMWGQVARKLLRLPKEGFAVATSCHADTLEDVLAMLRDDLRLPPEDVCRLGLIINIGLVGNVWPLRRRFLTVTFVDSRPAGDSTADVKGGRHACDAGPRLLPLATWNEVEDGFISASEETLDALAEILGTPSEEFRAAIERRVARMEELSSGRGVGPNTLRMEVDALAALERGDEIDAGGMEDASAD